MLHTQYFLLCTQYSVLNTLYSSMLNYSLKRILFFIPTWLIISVVIFGLSKCTSGDPVEQKLNMTADSNTNNASSDEMYTETAQKMGLDKPAFYFSITSKAVPDTLYRIARLDERNALEKLCLKYGNWNQISIFYHATKDFLSKISPNTEGVNFQNSLKQLLIQDDDDKISFLLNQLKTESLEKNIFQKEANNLSNFYQNVKNQQLTNNLFLPNVKWYGFDNQYHRWLSQFLTGNFGVSYSDDRRVADKLLRPLSITMCLSILAIFLAYFLGVPMGIFAAARQGTRGEKWLMGFVFGLYSVPSFWLATLAIIFLTTPEYGLKIFPSAGLADVPSDASFLQIVGANIGRVILPILCMSIHPMAVITRQMQGSVLETLQLDYIRTARAKGLTETEILRNHALRNAAFPLITMLGQLLPSTIAGSFVIEYIFNIEGMGWLTFQAIGLRDLPVIYTVLLLVAGMILIGNLLTDVLYRWANPRVRF